MSKTQVMIIDDDVKSIETLKEVLSDYPDLEVAWCASSCESGKEIIAAEKPDMLFLDIELPDGNGLEAIEGVRELSPDTYVVMFTAYYRQHEKQAFENAEHDYLLKPIDELELNKVVKRYRRHRLVTGSVSRPDGVPQPTADCGTVFTAATTGTKEMRVLRLCDIGYCRYSMRRKVWEAALSDHTFVQLKRGTKADDILKRSNNFVQTNQSYIVNIDYLLLVDSAKCRLLPPFDGEEIPVSGTYSRNLRNRFQEI